MVAAYLLVLAQRVESRGFNGQAARSFADRPKILAAIITNLEIAPPFTRDRFVHLARQDHFLRVFVLDLVSMIEQLGRGGP